VHRLELRHGELRGRDLAEALAEVLADDTLLVLDNCEHLVERCAELVHRLLGLCRGLRVLATSQQRLGVPGEVVWLVPALALPTVSSELTRETVRRSPAVQLFCERAASTDRRFVPSEANLEPIVDICRRLEGNPLAIELAAARVDVLSPADIVARLKDRFDLLRGGPGAGSARHPTLEAALQWSDQLLHEPERVLLRRLSVFVGGFSRQAAEDVCVGGVVDRHQVLDLLSGLIAKSLVLADTTGTVARYWMLETVRRFAAEGLAGAGEASDVSDRHAVWCIKLVAQAAHSDDDAAWVVENQLEEDNLRAAMLWALAEGRAELALRLASGLMVFWEGSGRFGEARGCLARALAGSESAPHGLRAVALHDIGFASFMVGDVDAARDYLCESLAEWEKGGDTAGAERTQGLLAFVSTFGDGPTGVEELEADLDEVRAKGDVTRLAEALVGCAHARMVRGEAIEAERHFEELVVVAPKTGDDSMVATALVGLGSAALGRGHYGRAGGHLTRGVALAVGCAASHTELVGIGWLVELARLRGDYDLARSGFEECLGRARSSGAPYPVAQALVGLGRVLLDEGEARAAQPRFEKAATVARRARLGHLLASALDGLGEVAMALDDVASARARFDEALVVARRFGDRATDARSTYHLAEIARDEGDLERAMALHHHVLRNRHQLGDRTGVVDSLEAVAGLAAVRGNREVAARVFGGAERLRDTGGFFRRPSRSAGYRADLGLLREGMAARDLEQTWYQGRSLSYGELVAYASRGRGPRKGSSNRPNSLSPAESDVVALAAERLSNAEIANRLFISPRTVQTHLRKAFAKLGVSSRQELRQAVGEGAESA
jgi:predicted ATPase/DNA-binding CsgD family transcriptional regulator